MLAFGALLLLVLPSVTLPASRTISVPIENGTLQLTFDPSRISESTLRQWARISPYSHEYIVPEWLELCVADREEYRPCGTRDWRAENFSYNAEVNLQKIRKRIEELDDAHYPVGLRDVVTYLRRMNEDTPFFQQQRLKFIQTWQPDVLASPYDGIQPAEVCSAEIALIRSTTDKQRAYDLAYKGWSHCINHVLRAKAGPYPVDGWKNALKRLSIQEEFIEDAEDE